MYVPTRDGGETPISAYEKTWHFARSVANTWRDEIKEALQTAYLKREEYLKAMPVQIAECLINRKLISAKQKAA